MSFVSHAFGYPLIVQAASAWTGASCTFSHAPRGQGGAATPCPVCTAASKQSPRPARTYKTHEGEVEDPEFGNSPKVRLPPPDGYTKGKTTDRGFHSASGRIYERCPLGSGPT